MAETAVIVDTECTGLKEPQPLEVAFTGPMEFDRENTFGTIIANLDVECITDIFFRPGKPVDFGAMATHHFFPGSLSTWPEWTGKLETPYRLISQYMIGHNVDYDWEAIGKPDIKRICTLAMARREWPDIDSHSLGALQYFFCSLIPDEMKRKASYKETCDRLIEGAHTANADVISCAYVLIEILNLHPQITSWQQLWEKSEADRVPIFMNFGKYGPESDWAKVNAMPKGMRCADVYDYDVGYYRWLFRECNRVLDDPYLQKALRSGVR